MTIQELPSDGKGTFTLAPSRTPLYAQLIADLRGSIEDGTYKPGDKLPSVRQISELRRLSITTVLKAYHELEGLGLIVAHPQSGYFVFSKPDYILPQTSVPISQARQVDVIDMVRLVLLDSNDESLIPFGSGIPAQDLLPTNLLNRSMIRLLQSQNKLLNITGTAEGSKNLRTQIAKSMFLFGTTVLPEDIVITAGCNEALFTAFAVSCRPGDQVVVGSPCYFGVLQILQELNLKAIEIPSDPLEGISIESLQHVLENNPIKAIYVNSNCNNPLGFCIPDDNKKRLIKLINKYDIPLIEDDSTGELFFGKSRPGTIKAHDTKGLVIYCSSYSKVAAPAYRIGWIIPGRQKEKVVQYKHALNLSTANLQQETIAEYLKSGNYDRHMRKVRQSYFQKTQLMSEAIRNHFPADTLVSSPQGGFFLWVQLQDKIDTLDLYKAARKQKISLAPGQMFSVNNNFSNYIRMNAAFYSQGLETIIHQLGVIIENLKIYLP